MNPKTQSHAHILFQMELLIGPHTRGLTLISLHQPSSSQPCPFSFFFPCVCLTPPLTDDPPPPPAPIICSPIPASAFPDADSRSLRCPVCQTAPSTQPYIALPCGHVHCYFCLRGALLRDANPTTPGGGGSDPSRDAPGGGILGRGLATAAASAAASAGYACARCGAKVRLQRPFTVEDEPRYGRADPHQERT